MHFLGILEGISQTLLWYFYVRRSRLPLALAKFAVSGMRLRQFRAILCIGAKRI